MAKKNTTGLPKKRKLVEAEQSDTPPDNLISRIQGNVSNETSLQRLIITVTAALVVLIAILVGGSLVWEYVIVPGQVVATVNNENITVAEFKERVRLERAIINQRFNLDLGILVQIGQDPNLLLQQEPYGSWWQEITGQPELLGSRVLDEMIEEKIVRAEAAERGITVDETAINREVEQFFNFNRPEATEAVTDPTATIEPTITPTPFVSPTPTSTPLPTSTATMTPTPTPLSEEEATGEDATNEETVPTSTPRPSVTPQPTRSVEERESEFNTNVENFYQQASRVANLDRETVRSYFEYEAILDALEDEIATEVTPETTYVNVRHILVGTAEEADNILIALENGESFADLARAVSTDTGSGARGGNLGWSPATNYVPEFRDATLEAEIGEIVGPVESEFGFHIIQVIDREEREMSEDELDRAKRIAFNEWLEDVTSEANNTINRGSNWPQHVPLEPQFVYDPVGVTDETIENES